MKARQQDIITRLAEIKKNSDLENGKKYRMLA